jgi:hypothetical protein
MCRRAATVVGALCALLVLSGSGAASGPSFTRISESAGGSSVPGDHALSAMSADGRYVLFSSTGAFVPDDVNGQSDAYLKDTATGTIERVSFAGDGAEIQAFSFGEDVSDNGRYVLFESTGEVVPGVTLGRLHLYLRDRLLGTTELIDVTYNGAEANNVRAISAHVSPDGRFVVFRTRAGNILPGMTNLCSACGYLFVRDRQSGTTIVGSAGSTGNAVDTQTPGFSLSDDGRYLTFTSARIVPTDPNPDLVPEDTNDTGQPGPSDDVYRRDLRTGDLNLLSVDHLGSAAGSSILYGATSDGGRALFRSDSPVTDDDPPAFYVRDVAAGTTARLPIVVGEFNFGFAFSEDGGSIAYGDTSGLSDGPGLYVYRLADGRRDFVDSASSDSVLLSHDGSRIAINTRASFAPGDTGTDEDVYIADFGAAGPVDADGDGIDDSIDTGDHTFRDGGTTAGTIGTIPAGVTVSVVDLPDPDGVRVTVSGTGTQKVTIALTNPASGVTCGTVKLAPGSDVELTCGSITAHVLAGTAEIVLSDDTSLLVDAGERATVSSSGGSFVVNAVSGGDGLLTLVSDGTSTQVAASSTPINLWDFVGFSAPVDNPPTFNNTKAGSNVPLKWRLVGESGAPVTNLTGASISLAPIACEGGGIDDLETVAASPSGLQNLGNGYYQLNWKTDKSLKGCKLMRLGLAGEGPLQHEARFTFK